MAQAGGHTFDMDRDSVMKDLNEMGYCVIPNVCSQEDCDIYIGQYKEWLSQFKGDDWPFQRLSLIQSYRIGHLEPTWNARVKTKDVFAQIWETEKLLTSFDAIAISPPPETGDSTFDTGSCWFHCDQAEKRQGLHAYQGALYLEETSPTDYCFRVLAGSHKLHGEFFERYNVAKWKSNEYGFYKLQGDEVKWYQSKGCVKTKVPVPKGGMVLWDSRTIHDNVKPEMGRLNTDRWRFVVFACMGPARWARPPDLVSKRKALKQVLMTTHWPCQGISYFSDTWHLHESKIKVPQQLPAIAKTEEGRKLAGKDEYDFEDGAPNGPDWVPKWKDV